MPQWIRQIDVVLTDRTTIYLALLIGVGIGYAVHNLMWSVINRKLLSKDRLCGACGYNLKHKPKRCPECGEWVKDAGLAYIHPKSWLHVLSPFRCGVAAGVLTSALLIIWLVES